MLKPPFSPQPIPPNSNADADNTESTAGTLNQNGTTSLSNTQPFLQASTSQPLSALDSLPTITGKSDHIIRPEYEIPAFLAFDLDLARLNRIHGHLWMAGRPMRARPLHRYTMLGMQVIQTQQMDLHLLKFSSKLLIKPLPEWILCHKFWTDWICTHDSSSSDDGKREQGAIASAISSRGMRQMKVPLEAPRPDPTKQLYGSMCRWSFLEANGRIIVVFRVA